MSGELWDVVDDVVGGVEFIGFENTALAEEASPTPSVPARPRRRRAVKIHKRTHPVRVMLDDDEFLKLNVHAKAQAMALPDYVRRAALRDPRLRVRPPMSADDLFARDKVTAAREKAVEIAVAPDPASPLPVPTPLSPDLERRIDAYFLPENRFERESPRSVFPHALARLGHFMTGLIGPRWSSHRAMPSAGT